MSSETRILDQLRTDLGYISTANLYSNNYKKVYEGLLNLGTMTDFDCICYYPGNRTPGKKLNSNQPASCELDIFIHIMFKAEKGEGKLVRKGEKCIDDFRKWFYRDSSVTAGKFFTLDYEGSAVQDVVEWNSRSLDEIQRFAIWDKDVAEIIFKLTINYSTN